MNVDAALRGRQRRYNCAIGFRPSDPCRAGQPRGVPLGARITGSDWADGGLTTMR